MYYVFVFLLAILIEIVFFCTIPVVLRLVRGKPFSAKAARTIAIVMFALGMTITQIIAKVYLNADTSGADLFAILLVLVNIYILKYDKNNPTNPWKSLKKNYKEVVKTAGIGLVTLLAVSLLIYLIMGAINNRVHDVWEDNEIEVIEDTKGLKEITTQEEFNKIITSKDKVIVLYTHEGCVFCTMAFPIIEDIANDYENFYYYNIDNGEVDYGFDMIGTPTLAIYKNGVFVAEKGGYNKDSYQEEVIDFLNENNAID